MDNIKPSKEAKLLVENKKSQTRKSFKERVSYTISNITVEPCILTYAIPNVIAYYAVQNLYLDKACRVNLQYNASVCDALRTRESIAYVDEEINVEHLHTSVSAWKNFVQTLLPCLMVLFVGAWSDRTGYRKRCMLIPIVADLISFIGYLSFSSFLYFAPMQYLAYFECVFPGIGGSWTIFLLGAFSYVSDVTNDEDRTVRVGAANMCLTFAVPLGTALCGVILKIAGFSLLFTMCIAFNLLSLYYVCFVLKESPLAAQIAASEFSNKSLKKAKFFDFGHIKSTFAVVFKTGSTNRKIRIFLILFVVCVVYGPWQGEITIILLYTRLKMNWNEFWFSMFNTYTMVVHFFGNLIAMGILSGKLNLDDATIGTISSTSKFFASFAYAFSTLSWHMYLAAIVDLFNGTSYIILRAIASKIVATGELGKFFSVFGFIESFMPMIFSPIYLMVYQATLDVFPGAVYILGASLTFTSIVTFLWFNGQHKKDKKIQMEKELEVLSSLEPT